MTENLPGQYPFEHKLAPVDADGGQYALPYTAPERIPPSDLRDVREIVWEQYPHRVQLGRRLFPSILAGRLRTPEAVALALQQRLDEIEALVPQSQMITRLWEQNVQTIGDLFIRKQTDEHYERFKAANPHFFREVSAAFASPLVVLPHARLAQVVVSEPYDPDAESPLYLDRDKGPAQEAAIREIVDKKLTTLPPRYAAAVILRYLYQGTGSSQEETGRLMGLLQGRAGRYVMWAIDRLRENDDIKSIYQQALSPDYTAALARLHREEELEKQADMFVRQAAAILADWDRARGDYYSQELAVVLNAAGRLLDDDVPAEWVKIPDTVKNIPSKAHFNRIIASHMRDLLLHIHTVGDFRSEKLAKAEEVGSGAFTVSQRGIAFARTVFARDNST